MAADVSSWNNIRVQKKNDSFCQKKKNTSKSFTDKMKFKNTLPCDLLRENYELFIIKIYKEIIKLKLW
jgi:hypothetical protein